MTLQNKTRALLTAFAACFFMAGCTPYLGKGQASQYDYQCENHDRFGVSFLHDDNGPYALVNYYGDRVRLLNAPAASGSKYENGNGMQIWFKDDRALFSKGAMVPYTKCQMAE